jgi:hypothetical protein
VGTAVKVGFHTRQAVLRQLSDYELLKKEFAACNKLISSTIQAKDGVVSFSTLEERRLLGCGAV